MPRISADTVAEHRDRTMTRLLDSFDQAIAEDNYADLTLAAIAERAGIARNTVYNYAKDKRALLLAAVDRAMNGVLTDLETALTAEVSARERLCDVIDRLLRDFSSGSPRVLVLQGLQEGWPLGRTQTDLPSAVALRTRIEDVVRRGIADGEFRPVEDVHLMVVMMAGALDAAVRALGTGERTPDAIARGAKSLILTALRP
jgi:AcrR family transcriptional regulator